MRTNKVTAALIVMVLLTGWDSLALADVAATVNPGDITYTSIQDEISIGWRFFVDRPIVITDLGLFDFPGHHSGLVGTHTMGIWRVKKTGGFRLERWATVGPGATSGSDNHVYVAIEPLMIVPDPEPYVVVNPETGVQTEYYERWMVGVWTPDYLVEGLLGDALIIGPKNAATLTIKDEGIIRFENYTWKLWAGPADTTIGDVAVHHTLYWAPWGNTEYPQYSDHHFGVNFKYNVLGPAANAGPDVAIYTSEQTLTTIAGTATHTVAGTSMEYRWLEGSNVLKDWTVVGAGGAASLSLAAPVASFSIGVHTLKLEVKDTAGVTASDEMTLTVSNTPPEAQTAPTYQIVEIGEDAIIIMADVADFDGDALTYEWLKGGEVLASGDVTPPAGGAAVGIEDLTIAAGDSRFPLGLNEVQLVVSDPANNLSVSSSATVEVKDTTAPTLAPTPSTALLWPPNHQLVPVTIWANALDSGGGSGIVLTASVQSSEPGDDDWYIDAIDNTAGTIALRLRAERSGFGDGRVYTITITATDGSSNQSVATVDIRVPHDKRKK